MRFDVGPLSCHIAEVFSQHSISDYQISADYFTLITVTCMEIIVTVSWN